MIVRMFNAKSLAGQGWGLTKRAPDVLESAAFASICLASGFSYISSIVHARTHAVNANRL